MFGQDNILDYWDKKEVLPDSVDSVSYTHLDVYKRQTIVSAYPTLLPMLM